MWGWIWGWSLFDPESDLWALLAAVGVMIGLVFGARLFFRSKAGFWFGATVGLYLGWVVRTIIFSDVPGGLGILIMIGSIILGGILGSAPLFHEGKPAYRGLISGVYIGFFWWFHYRCDPIGFSSGFRENAHDSKPSASGNYLWNLGRIYHNQVRA